MAQNIATRTTLLMLKARVIQRSGSLGENVVDIDLTILLNKAIIEVRERLGEAIDDFYKIPVTAISLTGTVPNYSASITTIDIASMRKRSLYSSTLGGEIPIYDPQEFNQIKTLYTQTAMGNNAVATLAQASGTYAAQPSTSTLTIRVYSGYASAATDLEFTIIRSPRYVSTNSDTIDIPEEYVPEVENRAVEIILTTKKARTIEEKA